MLDNMVGWLGDAYPWVKAIHVVVVIYWMAGLFMLPRFLVYHQEAVIGSPDDALWVHREGRLIAIILKPAMIAVWALGLALIVNLGAAGAWWFRLKFLLVVGLTFYQAWMIGYTRSLAMGERRVSGKTLRLLNEIPSLATILIVILVIVQPFG